MANVTIAVTACVGAVKGATPPVRLFPIYFPIGNLATGFFVIFALITGVVGIATSLTGLHDVSQGYPASMMSAAASSLVTWTLTVLAMGLACKEISLSARPGSLVTTTTNCGSIALHFFFLPACLLYTCVSVRRSPSHVQRTLEAFTIILTATQLLCAGSLHAGAHAVILETPIGGV